MLKKLIVLTLCSLSLQAAGIGVYMLNVIGEQGFGEESGSNHQNFGYSPGIGLSFDTNLGKNRVFGYRLNFEYYKAEGTDRLYYSDNFDSVYKDIDLCKTVFSVVNILDFGIYRSANLRVWVGPALSIHNTVYSHNAYRNSDLYYNNNYSEEDFELAPILGLNYNLNDHFSLAVDASYALLTTSTNSVKARAYLFWRFGETFEERIPKREQPSQVNIEEEEKNKTFEEKLKYLKSLRDQEILTEEEYQFKRKELVQSLKL